MNPKAMRVAVPGSVATATHWKKRHSSGGE
jgi:hypothetical protein